jgi:thiol:disulfide interchange protein
VRQYRNALATLVATAAVLGFAACERGGASLPSNGLPWESDLGSALARASAENKVVMVDFYTTWCGWCRKLDETTFADAGVKRALASVVPVRLDAEGTGRAAAARYGISGYPTIIFLDPNGREVGRIPGYLPADAFLQELQDVLRQG